MTRDPLAAAGAHARWVLAAGLVAGALLPGAAAALAGWLVPLIVLVMFLGALRVPPSRVAGIWQRPWHALALVLALQLAVPLCLVLALRAAGLTGSAWAWAMVLVLAAPSIVSSPNMAAMLGLDEAFCLRLVLWGTALVPLTAIPVLWALDGGDPQAVALAALRLAGVVALGAGGGLWLRARLPALSAVAERRLDGASALALAVFVVALMPAFATTLAADPAALAGWLGFAFALNFGAQALVARLAPDREAAARARTGALALVAGNRNLALFFAALPAAETARLLPFLAAYQVPMFLTPLLLARLYGHRAG